MKRLLFAAILCTAVISYAQGRGGQGAKGGPPAGAGGGMSSSGTGASSRGASSHGTSSHGTSANTPNRGSQPRSPQDLLDQNKKLSANLQKLLPAGTTPQQACSGFKNLGQCVAAIHVSHNLGISFSDLKGKMTGANSDSLGKAIKDLDPKVDAKAERKKAEKQAKRELSKSAA